MIRKQTGPVAFKQILRPILPLLLLMSSMGGFLGNSILMSLNTVMPASLLYPLVNGGIAVIVAIASCVIFREKLTLQRLMTILVGQMENFIKGFLRPLLVVGIFCLLLILEPDFGTTALFGTVAIILLFVRGVKLKFIIPASIFCLMIFGLAIFLIQYA